MTEQRSLPNEAWSAGDAYEPYVGRWSRLVATESLTWLAPSPGAPWLDVGCGTGALCQAILHQASPRRVYGLDRSAEYAAFAHARTADSRAAFVVGDAQAIPFADHAFEQVVSGLVLNFVARPDQATAEMARVTRGGGTVAVYVWDYAGEMQLMRYFWDAAAALDPAAHDLDEGRRFPMCHPDRLRDLLASAGLNDVTVRAIDVPTHFRDFDDYWLPFLGGQGPAPGYAMSLSKEHREALRDLIRKRLPIAPDGSIHLIARAWAVRGVA